MGWAGASAIEIASAVRIGGVSPLEVVDAHLSRIAAIDHRINAFRIVRVDEVRAEARALATRDDFRDLPLAGVPVAVKDNLDLAGCVTGNGSRATRQTPAEADSELVRRLRAAGALLIGKTNVPELCQWPVTESAAHGSTRNPWQLEHTPGGSTGGGAAAVSSGMAALAIGSDGGGSIRIPSSCCGLIGLKPGDDVVPRPPELGTNWLGISTFGPLATTVADAALLLDVLAAVDEYRDPAPPTYPLRIGMTVQPPVLGASVAPPVRTVLHAAAEALRAAGHTVTEAPPPWRPQDTLGFLARYFAGVAEDTTDLSWELLEPLTRKVARTGRLITRLRRVPDAPPPRQSARFAAWFTEYDLLLTPTLATPPVPIGAFAGQGLVQTVLHVPRFIPFTPPFNTVRYPAMSIPAGHSDDGLPIGIQLAAAPGGESTLLGVAAQLEEIRPWPRHASLDHAAPQ
ncbi:amidase [Nocardia amamiensis]|uniref:amidase n=1 Tax=Nocardia amamiensis TaxID=404578 RepID=A0ABS0CYW3_9NOCA|nr:amidase family protein [Nocardia amamiensis]MBF6301792.1 amidase [Nocardia amamiensis]